MASRRNTHLEDPGAELLDTLTGFWGRYGRVLLIALAVVAAVVALAVWRVRASGARENEAAGKLAEANVYFWQNDYPRTIQMAKQVADQFPSTPSGQDAHRLIGDASFWSGDFKTATSEYHTYLAHAKAGVLADAARRSLGYSLESQQQFKDAAPVYDSVVGKFDRETSAEMLMAEARCQRLAQQPQAAVKSLQRLLDEYGETSLANRARIELGELTFQAR